jgi:predicted ABC-type transport system involved in lysophospholipase L1 biosynthesis ATPase subunit
LLGRDPRDLAEYMEAVRGCDLLVVCGMGGLADVFADYALGLLDSIGSDIPEGKMVKELSVGQMQMVEIAKAFQAAGVEYLFIGKSGAVLLGYPDTTQDADLLVDRSPENGRALVLGPARSGIRAQRSFFHSRMGHE